MRSAKKRNVQYPLLWDKIHKKGGCPGYDSELLLTVRLQLWGFRKRGVPLHCHFSRSTQTLICSACFYL